MYTHIYPRNASGDESSIVTYKLKENKTEQYLDVMIKLIREQNDNALDDVCDCLDLINRNLQDVKKVLLNSVIFLKYTKIKSYALGESFVIVTKKLRKTRSSRSSSRESHQKIRGVICFRKFGSYFHYRENKKCSISILENKKLFQRIST